MSGSDAAKDHIWRALNCAVNAANTSAWREMLEVETVKSLARAVECYGFHVISDEDYDILIAAQNARVEAQAEAAE